jgi:hypothetical protein
MCFPMHYITEYNGLSWRDALKAALNEGKIRPVAGGEAEGRSFYVSALLGAPALWAPAREAVRNMDLRTAWSRARRAMLHAFSRKLHLPWIMDPLSKRRRSL